MEASGRYDILSTSIKMSKFFSGTKASMYQADTAVHFICRLHEIKINNSFLGIKGDKNRDLSDGTVWERPTFGSTEVPTTQSPVVTGMRKIKLYNNFNLLNNVCGPLPCVSDRTWLVYMEPSYNLFDMSKVKHVASKAANLCWRVSPSWCPTCSVLANLKLFVKLLLTEIDW